MKPKSFSLTSLVLGLAIGSICTFLLASVFSKTKKVVVTRTQSVEASCDCSEQTPAATTKTTTDIVTLNCLDGAYDYSSLVKSKEQGWGKLMFNTNVVGTKIQLNKKEYSFGLGTHATSKVDLDLRGQFTQITGLCGVDDQAEKEASITCHIDADGKEIFSSILLKRGNQPTDFNLDIKGVKILTLRVEDGGDGIVGDWANWANIRLEILPQEVAKN